MIRTRSATLLLSFLWLFLKISKAEDALVNCTLCKDGNPPNDPTARLVTGSETLTCEDLYERGTLELPESNCTALQNAGRNICLCEDELPTVNNCTLCEDGSNLPRPTLEGASGITCAQVQNQARQDDFANCFAYQATAGIYCQCGNPKATAAACRLCGQYDLPDPFDVTEGVTGNITCARLEFEANLPGEDNCSDITNRHAEFCCRNVPMPTPAPTSSVVSASAAVAVAMAALATTSAMMV